MLERDIIVSLLTGLISGVLAAGICLVIARFWRASVVPWVEERVYDEFNLAGRWSANWRVDAPLTNPPAAGKDEWDIMQSAHRIHGTIRSVEGYDRTSVYAFEGSFKNNVLTLTYNDVDKSFTSRGTVTLAVRRNGQSLIGIGTFYDEESDDIGYTRMVLQRVKRESPSTQAPTLPPVPPSPSLPPLIPPAI
jgi:hypothetical protein